MESQTVLISYLILNILESQIVLISYQILNILKSQILQRTATFAVTSFSS